jgi:hypothetical protein
LNADLKQAFTKEAGRLSASSLAPAAMDWTRRPDAALRWVPDKLLPLDGCANFVALTAQQRLTYNQAYARQLLEEFIWIESRMVVAPLRRLTSAVTLGADAAMVFTSFLTDEQNHIACFARLRQDAIAAAGAAPSEQFFQPPVRVAAMAAAAGLLPRPVSFWTGVVTLFEEYAVAIGKHYKDDDSVDPVFRDIFIAHARDEARHCRFDNLLSAWLSPPGRTVLNTVNYGLGISFQSAYYATRWGLSGPIRFLTQRHPEIAALENALIEDARLARERAKERPRP